MKSCVHCKGLGRIQIHKPNYPGDKAIFIICKKCNGKGVKQ